MKTNKKLTREPLGNDGVDKVDVSRFFHAKGVAHGFVPLIERFHGGTDCKVSKNQGLERQKKGKSAQYEVEITTGTGKKKCIHFSVTPKFDVLKKLGTVDGSQCLLHAAGIKPVADIYRQIIKDRSFGNPLQPLYPDVPNHKLVGNVTVDHASRTQKQYQ